MLTPHLPCGVVSGAAKGQWDGEEAGSIVSGEVERTGSRETKWRGSEVEQKAGKEEGDLRIKVARWNRQVTVRVVWDALDVVRAASVVAA